MTYRNPTEQAYLNQYGPDALNLDTYSKNYSPQSYGYQSSLAPWAAWGSMYDANENGPNRPAGLSMPNIYSPGNDQWINKDTGQPATQDELAQYRNFLGVAPGTALPTPKGPSADSFMDKAFSAGIPLAAGLIGMGAGGLGPLAGAGGGSAGATFAGQPMANTTASLGDTAIPGVQWDAPPPTGGGMTNSIMNNPYAGGLGGTGGVDLSAAGLGSSGVPIGTSGLGTGAGSLMGDAATGGLAGGAAEGGDIWSTINGLLGPTPINGVTGAGLLGAGINYLTQNRAAGQYRDLANTVRQSGSALNDPQRTPYQSNLSNLVNNPSQYMATDPFAQALTAQYKNNVIPRNVAASGNPASVIDEKGSQFAAALAGNYNTQVGQMSGIAGFGFPPSGYTPSAVGAAGSGAIGAQATGIGGLANLVGQNFAQPPQGTSGTKGIFGTGVA